MIALVGVEIEHARERRDPGFRDVLTREQRGLDVEDGRIARTNGEAERAGQGRAVEQRMNDDGFHARLRLFKPELSEQCEFLAFRIAGTIRKRAGGQSVILSLGHGAEIGCAEEDGTFFHDAWRIDRIAQTQAREAEIIRDAQDGVGIGEEIGIVGNGRGLPARDLVHSDPRLVQEAAWEELHVERQILTMPQRLLGIEGNAAELVEIHVRDGIGQRRRRRGIGLLRQALCQKADCAVVKRRRFRHGGSRRWRSRCGCGCGLGMGHTGGCS